MLECHLKTILERLWHGASLFESTHQRLVVSEVCACLVHSVHLAHQGHTPAGLPDLFWPWSQ
jgi:hypothetical protein